MIPPDPPAVAWYATADHPRGACDEPVFDVVGTFIYPSDGHPRGPSARPWYQVRDSDAYPVDGHPDGPSKVPSFRVVGGGVHPFAAENDAMPWFRIGRGRTSPT